MIDVLMKFVFAVVGAVFGLLSAIALTPVLAAFLGESGKMSLVAFLVVMAIGSALSGLAPTMRRAFGRGFLMLGAAVFALPISAFMLSAKVATDMVSTAGDDAAMTALGAGAAGVMVTGIATFFGFILGAILMIAGLVLSLGGRREVIVVEAKTPQVRREPRMK